MTIISNVPKLKFISLLCSIFIFIYPFLLAYPFLIIYLVFSLPYIIKILCFLSPVFIVAFVLFTAFLLILTNKSSGEFAKNELGLVPNGLHDVVDKKIAKFDKEDGKFYPLEALEFYCTVFGTFMIDETYNIVDNAEELPEEKILQTVESSILGISQNNEEECRISKDESFACSSKENYETVTLTCPREEKCETDILAFPRGLCTVISNSLKEDFIDDGLLEIPKCVVKEKSFEEFLKEVDEVEYMEVDKQMVNMDCMRVDKSFDEKGKLELEIAKSEPIKKRHSRRRSTKTNIDFSEDRGGRFSKKEKEWKKTLACKLFEEKNSNNNIEDCEGMDLLWETYDEKTISMGNSRNEINYENGGQESKNNNIIGNFEDDDDDEEEIDVHVSCLHAFKFSGGKMNMGVGGRNNLVRISKVIKGIKWLRSVTKHGKKMSNNEEKCLFGK